jgi:hypothetical protein
VASVPKYRGYTFRDCPSSRGSGIDGRLEFSCLRSLWHAIAVPAAPVVAHELVAVVVKLATVARESSVIVSVIEFIVVLAVILRFDNTAR